MFENKGKNSKYSYIITKETIGMTLMLFSVIVFVVIATRDIIFADIGVAVCAFLYGTFGYGCFPLIFLIAYIGSSLAFGRNYRFAPITMLTICITAFCLFLLLHSATTKDFAVANYGEYIKACYMSTKNGYESYTFGGVVCALVAYLFARLITFTGAMIVFSLLTIVSGYISFLSIRRYGLVVRLTAAKKHKGIELQEEEDKEVEEEHEDESELHKTRFMTSQPDTEEKLYGIANSNNSDNLNARREKSRQILFGKGEYGGKYKSSDKYAALSNANSNATSATGPSKSYSDSYRNDVLGKQQSYAPTNYVFNDHAVESLDDYESDNLENYTVKDEYDNNDYSINNEFDYDVNYEEQEDEVLNIQSQDMDGDIEEECDIRNISVENIPQRPSFEDAFKQIDKKDEDKQQDRNNDDFFKFSHSVDSAFGGRRTEINQPLISSKQQNSNANLFDNDDEEDDDDCHSNNDIKNNFGNSQRVGTNFNGSHLYSANTQNTHSAQNRAAEEPKRIARKYVRPSLDLLKDYPEYNNINAGEIEENKELITNALSECKIGCSIKDVVIGPSVTRYDVVIEDRTKISEAEKHKKVVAMALKKDGVSTYLNYAKGALSVEVPNAKRSVVGLKCMLASSQFVNSKPNSIAFALGKNLEGEIICPDITNMPHMLVAGTSGSGKSICLNSLLISLLYKYGPDELRLILVDPKQVEFISFDRLPHLMINEIITDVNKTIKALEWAVQEMNRRYTLMMEMSTSGKAATNISEYNANLTEGETKLPKIVVVLDEFGDLMMQSKREVENRIIKLAQKARACGIHLVLATQRPSVDCVTPLIKANLPTRISFKVASADDSRTIFNMTGAEKLLGKGDMYFSTPDYPHLVRLQGCLVSPSEVQAVCNFVKQNNDAYFDQSASDFINKVEEDENSHQNNVVNNADEQKMNEEYLKVLKCCIRENKASTAFIQRKFPIGYVKTCRIIEWMENMGYIAPAESSNKPRKMLITMEEFIDQFGNIGDD